MKIIKEYKDYNKYIEDQAEKTLKGRRNRLRKFDSKVKKFEQRFKQFVIKPNSKILCLGAREGEECLAFNNLGHDAIGIDIVEHTPLVIKGDFNNIDFPPQTFDLVYTNTLDHSYLPELMMKGIHSVLKDYGLLWVDVFLNMVGDKEVIEIDNTLEVVEFINGFDFVCTEHIESKVKLYKNKQKEICMLFRKEVFNV